MTDKSYLFWNSLELIEAYRKKHLSPVEVVKNSIEQAHKVQNICNAFTEFFEEKSLKLAEFAEKS